jgi:pre-mRNA-splicing factor CDC5/CEF1
MNEAAQQKRRGRMMLPAPQISDAELEQLARAGEHAVAMDADITGGEER